MYHKTVHVVLLRYCLNHYSLKGVNVLQEIGLVSGGICCHGHL